MATGIATIDFGSWPGSNEASVTISSQTGILSTSNVEAYFMANDSTADHSTGDHQYAPCLIKVTCGSIVVNTSFVIYGRCTDKMQGTFKVHWVWA
jgi:hypothetical protein